MFSLPSVTARGKFAAVKGGPAVHKEAAEQELRAPTGPNNRSGAGAAGNEAAKYEDAIDAVADLCTQGLDSRKRLRTSLPRSAH